MAKIKELCNFVMEGDTEEAVQIAQELLASADTDVKYVVEQLGEVMKEIGVKFENFEVFLPELVVAADSFLGVMEVLEPKLLELNEGKDIKKITVVLGTVKGDFHEIGKTIVALVLQANGIKVVDLGTDVDAIEFIDAAEENNAEFIGLSALMTTTMPAQQELIKLMEERGVRDKFKVLVGGAPTSQEWSDEIKADGWSFDAFSTARLIAEMVEQ